MNTYPPGHQLGALRREYVDWLSPFSEPHLRSMLNEWVTHYNGARPHIALGPGVPNPHAGALLRAKENSQHPLGARAVVWARSFLGGLHQGYSLAPALA